MALTYTPPAEIGHLMPKFQLPSTEGTVVNSVDFNDQKALVVLFICNHCPYVQAIENRLIRIANQFKPKQVGFVAICSNDSSDYNEDSFENLKKRAEEMNYPFPYLHDEDQTVAKSFGAVCTPDIFVFKNDSATFNLFYRGRLDDSWKDEAKVEQQELATALETLLAGDVAPETQVPSMGCSIKWKES